MAKRQILHKKYDICSLVESAIEYGSEAELDLKKSREELFWLGNRNPDDETVIRYAREKAILNYLSNNTGANFLGQIGKIDFSNREKAITGVNDYLNRRINGHRARWTEEHKRR